MTNGNDRLNDPDADTDDGTAVIGHGDRDKPFESFAVWVNNPVSPYSKHHVPEDLRTQIDAVDDAIERQRLRTVVEKYEDGTLSPRDFVRLIMESDAVDYFDPLSVPEGWDSTVDEAVPEAEYDDWENEDVEQFREHVDAGPDRPDHDFPWVEVAVGLLIIIVITVAFLL